MDFRILGPLEIQQDGRPLPCRGAKQRLLLAVLLLHANEVVSTDRLIEALWGEQPPATANKALQVHVSQLRRLLGTDEGEILRTRSPGYELHVDDHQLDLKRFELGVRQARAASADGRTAVAAELLRSALALWSGPPLADLMFEDSLQSQIARLEELRLTALEDRIDADLALGRHAELVAELERLATEHPLRERVRGQLMLALYRCGRQAEALAEYRQTRNALVDEQGIEPGRPLQALHQAILAQDPALDVAAAGSHDFVADHERFVGRTRELTHLLGRLERARSGHGAIVILAGDPGMGKTRLADELARKATASGFAAHWGRSWEAGGAPPYWPWVQALRSCVRSIDPTTLDEALASGAGEIRQLLPELGRPAPSPAGSRPEAEGERFQMFAAVASLVRRLAIDRPQFFVLDDLHAADTASILLLEFMAREIADVPVLFVVTYRDSDLDPEHPLRGALPELGREPETSALALAGLDVSEVGRYLELSLDSPPSADLVAVLHDRTDGNPLFIGEIARLLVGGDSEDVRGAARTVVPQTIRDVIGRRLGRLSDECREMLATAAVLGRDFSLPLLARVSGSPPDAVLDVLDEAAAAQIVAPDAAAPARYRFLHILIRDTLYGELPSRRRLDLHFAVAEALAAVHGRDADHLPEIAYHYLAAAPLGGVEKAVVYAERAGARATEMLAFEEAARHYQAALSALDAAGDADGDRHCALFLGLGEAQARAGAQAAARAAFWRASELAETLGRSGVQARAALGYGGRFLWGRAAMDERLAPMLERALAALDPSERRLRVLLMARLAGATRTGGLAAPIGPADLDGAYARAIGAEAVQLARELEDPEVLAYALEGHLLALCGPDSIGEQLELAREVLVLARGAGDHERLFGGIENLCHIMLELGDVITAERHAEELLRLAELMRQPPQLWMAHAVRASLALWRGQLDVAEAAIEEAFGYGRDAQTWNAEITYHVQTFMLRRAQLRLDEAEAGLRQALADHPSYQLIRCLLADLLALLGRASEARTVLDALAPRAFRAVPRDDTWLHAMAVLAEATAAVGHREHAKTLLRLLARYEDRIAYVAPDGSAGALARGLGLLAVTAGEQATATRYFDRALAINERTESRTALADTQRDYARLLGAGPEREELASLALAHYESMGMFAAAEAMRAEQPV